ncbi:MAG: glycosyltransferase family 39 protein [candidate division Zixibacteria bacterium]
MRKIESRHLWALIIFVVALALRIIYFLQVKDSFPGWDSPTIDPLYHDLWARQIASGDLLGAGPFFRAPFYAYFLGLIYAFFGPSLAVSKIIQHIIGSATCSLIFLFAEKYFGRRVAIMSGLVSAFYWVLIYFEDELLLDSLLVLFGLILIWSLMRAAEKTTGKSFFIAGIFWDWRQLPVPTSWASGRLYWSGCSSFSAKSINGSWQGLRCCLSDA